MDGCLCSLMKSHRITTGSRRFSVRCATSSPESKKRIHEGRRLVTSALQWPIGWNRQAAMYGPRTLDRSNLDDEIGNLEIRQVGELRKLLRVDATELSPARDSAKELLETLKMICPQ